jgi:hypothetical protein
VVQIDGNSPATSFLCLVNHPGYQLPDGEPLTLMSYAAGLPVEIYLEHVAVEAALPEMPLFLRPDRYVNVPLEPTYQAAYRGLPAFWREVLENPSPPAA